MDPLKTHRPFHAGEIEAQARAGVGDVAKWAGGFIRDHLPEQHRAFHTSLPFLVVAGADQGGLTWVTLVDGTEGFITSPDPKSLVLDTDIDPQDPLAQAFSNGTDVGIVGIELATRRRNRLSGRFQKTDLGYRVDVRQTFGNCPQYIHERGYTHVPRKPPLPAHRSEALNPAQIAQITQADTLFIGSGHQIGGDVPSRGYDASHRGGAAGFVTVTDPRHISLPDYAGNNFFNTIGNLVADPRVGLVFVDFKTGGLLHLTGRATVDWTPRNAHDPDALRMIHIEIDAVHERPEAIALRWNETTIQARNLRITRREQETPNVTSFYLSPADGGQLHPFKAGQHLPIRVEIPGRAGTSDRSYSLSGSQDLSQGYRISIKREEHGLVSRHFHDALKVGSMIKASTPAGDFVLPDGDGPLVLASAGVGITPMVAMLHETIATHSTRPVWFVHGTQNRNTHALIEDVDRLIAAHSDAQQRIFYSNPEHQGTGLQDGHIAGRITAGALLDLKADPGAQYMLCGPSQFLSDIRVGLETAGVPAEHIHHEVFGPAA